jgi:outer membrane protein assembly factor BamB
MDLARGAALRLGRGSLLMAEGKLIILSEQGELVVAPATPAGFPPAARARALGGACWSMPVLAGGRIDCRSHEGDLACADLSNPGRHATHEGR